MSMNPSMTLRTPFCLTFLALATTLPAQGTDDRFGGVWSAEDSLRLVVYDCAGTYSGIFGERDSMLAFKLAKTTKDTLAGQVELDGKKLDFTFVVGPDGGTLTTGKKSGALRREHTDPFDAVAALIDVKEYDTAWKHVNLLSAQNHAHGLFVAGLMTQNGWGVDADPKQGNELYRRATEAGSVFAPNNLGVSYRDGRGIAKDLEKALEAFQRGALRGDSQAALNAGALLLNGDGMEIEMVEGCAWLCLSNEQNAKEARDRLLPKLSEAERKQLNKRVTRLQADRDGQKKKAPADTSGTVRMTLTAKAGKFTVATLAAGSKTKDSGIEVGDELLAVDDTPVAGLEFAQVEKLLAGHVGSNIQLRFDRAGENVLIAMPREAAAK